MEIKAFVKKSYIAPDRCLSSKMEAYGYKSNSVIKGLGKSTLTSSQ